MSVPYLGDFAEDETVYIPFNTFDSNDPSASVTVTNLAAGDVHVHKDGSTTQATTNGATVSIDFDTITGNHLITIDTSADAYYATGSDYQVRLEGITVDGATLNVWIGQFSIENRYSAGALRPTTAGRTLDVTATGAAGIDWGNIENKTTANDLSGTDIQLVDTCTLTSTTTDVTNAVTANTTQISGSATAADNLELVYNGVEGFAMAYMGPRGPGVYLNDGAANTNTTNGTDGTFANPVSTIAAAKTLADSMSMDRIYLINDSAITLAATMEDYEFVGIGQPRGNVITLGGQDVDNSSFYNIEVTGAQGGTGLIHIKGGVINAVTSMQVYAQGAGILGTCTLDATNDSFWDQCYSMVPGNGTPQVTFATNSDFSVRHYSGGLQINSMAGTNTMSYETDGQLVIDATCSAGAVTIRGNCSVTDNAGGAVTVTEDARVSQSRILDAVVDDATQIDASALNTASTAIGSDGTGLTEAGGTGDQLTAIPWNAAWDAQVESEVTDALNAYDPPTNAEMQARTLVAANYFDPAADTVDVGKISGSATAADNLEASALGIITGTASGTPTTTVIESSLTGYTDDQLIGRVIIFTSGNADGEATDITDYANTNGTITVTALSTAPAASDVFVIV